MDITDKLEFVQSTIQPMAWHTFPYIASIVGVDADGRVGLHLGSALRLLTKTERLVVTAAHVAESVRRSSYRIVVSGQRGAVPIELGEPAISDEEADLAIFPVSDDYPRDGIGFWPQQQIDTSIEALATDFLFVHGFPAIYSEFLPLRGGISNKSFAYGVMCRDDDLPLDLSSFQFAMDFDLESMRQSDGQPADWIDPRGLSGSPVFRIGASGKYTDAWAPEHAQLIGFLTQWRPDQKLIVATMASRLVRLLEQSSTPAV